MIQRGGGGGGRSLWSSEGRYPGLLGKVRAGLEQRWAALGWHWAQAPMGVTAAGPGGALTGAPETSHSAGVSDSVI